MQKQIEDGRGLSAKSHPAEDDLTTKSNPVIGSEEPGSPQRARCISGPFDYSTVAAETASELRRDADYIRKHQRSIGASIFEIGRTLLAAKDRVPHGQFGAWLKAEFDWTDRTARNFMRAAERFDGKTEIISDLPPTAIYMLSAPSTPPAVVDEIVTRRAAGEHVSLQIIKDLVADGRAAARRAKEEAKTPCLQNAKKKSGEKRPQHRTDWKGFASEAENATREALADQIVDFLATRLSPGDYSSFRNLVVDELSPAGLSALYDAIRRRPVKSADLKPPAPTNEPDEALRRSVM